MPANTTANVASVADLDPSAMPPLLGGPMAFLLRQTPRSFALVGAAYMIGIYYIASGAYMLHSLLVDGLPLSYRMRPHGWDNALYVLTVLTAPPVETLVELVLVFVLKAIRIRNWLLVFVAATIMTAMHGHATVLSALGTWLLEFVLATAMIHWLPRSWWSAFWVPALLHWIYNLWVILDYRYGLAAAVG